MPALPFTVAHPGGAPFRGDVHLPSGGGRAPVVVLCHGFKGFKDWGFMPFLADRLAEAGLAAVRFNFSLNGIDADPERFTALDRFARNTLGQEVADLDLVIQRLREGALPGAERMDRRRLSLFGHSRGGGIALVRALEDVEIRAVATWASVASFWGGVDPEAWRRDGRLVFRNARTGQDMPVDFAAWEEFDRGRARYDILSRLPTTRAYGLFVHGRADASVPCEASERLARWMGDRGSLHLIGGADHAFGAVHPFRGATPALAEAVRVTAAFLAANT